MLEPTIKEEGATSSERYLAKLANDKFFGLWSYPNVYTDEGISKIGIGKELCDLLIVFQNSIIIFSDKNCAFDTDIELVDKIKSSISDFIITNHQKLDIDSIDTPKFLSLAPGSHPNRKKEIIDGNGYVYFYIHNGKALKVGKAGPKSHARILNHHYHPNSSSSNLAKSLLDDPDLNISDKLVTEWISDNTTKVLLQVSWDKMEDEHMHMYLGLLESWFIMLLRPKYEKG